MCESCNAGAGGLTSALHRQEPSAAEARGQMLSLAYPVLDSFLQRPAWRAHEPVVTAVCEVYSHVMCTVQVGLWCAIVRQSAIHLQSKYRYQYQYPAKLAAGGGCVAELAPSQATCSQQHAPKSCCVGVRRSTAWRACLQL